MSLAFLSSLDIADMRDRMSLEAKNKKIVLPLLQSKFTETFSMAKKDFSDALYEDMFANFEALNDDFINKTFHSILNFLLKADDWTPSHESKWAEKLNSSGYNLKKFRHKLVEDNKEFFIKAVTVDIINEALDNIVDNSYFKSYDFTNVFRNKYTQDKIIIKVLKMAINQTNYREMILATVDNEISIKIKELDDLKAEIADKIKKLEEI